MPASIDTLADLLDRRRLTMDEVLTWASAIAAQLSTLHEHGQSYGDVAAGSVWIDGDIARLAPAARHARADQPRDIIQFAALLREMLESVPVETDAARTQWIALDRIATTNSRAGSDSSVKKVAWALKLMCSARRMAAPPRSASPAAEIMPEPESGHVNRRFLLLVREVVPEGPATPRRFVPETLHIWAFLASAVAIAVLACILFLRFLK